MIKIGNQPIVSILISSRKRPESFRRTLQSFVDTCPDKSRFEFIIRCCFDDLATFDVARSFFSRATTRILTSWPLDGYSSCNVFYTELAMLARGQWCWMMGDDVLIQGCGWDVKLADVPLTGFIVEPDISGLGLSTYHKVPSGPFPCLPTDALRECNLYNPWDRCIDLEVKRAKGWTDHFLPGIKLQHNNEDQPGDRERRLEDEKKDLPLLEYIRP